MRVAGEVVAVIGGGSGIGREVVLELLRRGARVAAVDLRRDALERTVELAGTGAPLATFELDVPDRTAVEALPDEIAAALGDTSVLVNVAGIIQPFVRVVDLDWDAIHRVVDVNLYGTLHTVKAFLPRLLQRPTAHVVNVSSMGGFLPVPGQTVYGASKAAVRLLTEGLYAELLDTSVGVTLVFPGAVRTEITANSGIATPGASATGDDEGSSPRMPMTDPDVAARTIVDGIEADRLYVFVGKDARATNLLQRLAPRRAAQLVQRRMRDLLA